jgi:type I restriction enzyme M protein
MRWEERDDAERQHPRTGQSFCVPKAEVAAAAYDLSLNRYKEMEHEDQIHAAPVEIIRDLKRLEEEIANGIASLEEMLR